MDKGILLSETLLVQTLPTLMVSAVPLSQEPVIPAGCPASELMKRIDGSDVETLPSKQPIDK